MRAARTSGVCGGRIWYESRGWVAARGERSRGEIGGGWGFVVVGRAAGGHQCTLPVTLYASLCARRDDAHGTYMSRGRAMRVPSRNSYHTSECPGESGTAVLNITRGDGGRRGGCWRGVDYSKHWWRRVLIEMPCTLWFGADTDTPESTEGRIRSCRVDT